MIEINNADPEATLAQLTRQLADARRGLQATEQALLDERAAGRNAFVMAAAAHAYCAARERMHVGSEASDLHKALLATHQVTTPSGMPPTHVVIGVEELASLRAIADAAAALMNDQQCLGDGDLRVALDNYPGGTP